MSALRKFCLTGFLVFSVFSGGCSADTPERIVPEGRDREAPNWCEHNYLTGKSGDQRVCSLFPLTEEQLTVIDYQLGYAVDAYKRWARKNGNLKPVSHSVTPHFYIVTFELINDRTVFKRTDKWEKIAGRYIPEKGWIFVTERAFTKDGYLDIPHEVCHWLNNLRGISVDPEEDERLCSEFELYYERRLPYGKRFDGCKSVLGTPVCE